MKLSALQKFEIVKHSDRIIDEARAKREQRRTKPSVAMWLDLSARAVTDDVKPLVLDEVVSESDWSQMRTLRQEVETAFGVTNPQAVDAMVEEIKLCRAKLPSHWFLARTESSPVHVGEIGIVIVTVNNLRVGRLQDVDILPRFQNKGLGKRLIVAALHFATDAGLHAVCLKADTDDWPVKWYQRLGFEPVGEWRA